LKWARKRRPGKGAGNRFLEGKVEEHRSPHIADLSVPVDEDGKSGGDLGNGWSFDLLKL